MEKVIEAFKKETNKEFNDVNGEITQIRKNQGELNEIKSELAQFIKLATETDTKLETMVEAKLIETKQTVSQQIDDKVRDMKDNLSESLVIEKRKNNLIFHGVKETDGVGDRDYIAEILKDGLQMDAERRITEVSRVGKYVKDKVLKALRVS